MDESKKGIITVIGHDRVGIIARVCAYLSERGVNILDISQSIIQGYFNMLMIVDLGGQTPFDALESGLAAIGEEIGVIIKLQHEDIFNTMHRL
ncbi:MAG: ACT domain-containing protein [Clostridiales bacterium]|jgi:ACT domain-containing protein|nr:ACT domain-containing protein [Clostridiales bacterium]